MSDKKISQLPIGNLTDNSKLLFVNIINNDDNTYQMVYSAFSNYFLIAFNNADTFITGGTYNNGITTLTNNHNDIITAIGYQTGYLYTLEDLTNKQNNMLNDNFNVKYPTVDAVNNQNNLIARISINTGFIDTNDNFIMTRLNDFTLRLSASTRGIIFKSLIKNNSTIDAATLQIPLTDIPLSAIGLNVNGIYIKFIGYTDSGTTIYSNTTFELLDNVCQLGVLILKVTGGTTSFEDATRGVINKPDVSSYSNLEVTLLELTSNVVIIPNTGLTISNSSGSLKGISVNWHGLNNDLKIINSNPISSFTHLSYANALSTTPPPFVSAVTTNQYWNGVALVNLSTSGAATVQRWLLTINGTLALQYGEREYTSLFEATNNVTIANFQNILPLGTYAEIGRMVSIRNTTNLSDINQCIFYIKNNGNFTLATNIEWGQINGRIDDQPDLKLALDSTVTYENPAIVNLGTATTGGDINIDLNQGKNLKLTLAVTADTKINITPRTNNANNENTILLRLLKYFSTPISFATNLNFDQNIYPIMKTDMFTNDNLLSNIPTNVVGYEAYTIGLFPDNKLLIGGYFGNYIYKANQDGTVDNSYFTPVANGVVYSIVVQPDSKAIVGGQFTTFNSVTANRLVRLNSDGTVDNTFNIGTGFNATVSAVTIQNDGKILCGGDFTQFSGVPANRIIRLNPNGSRDITFSGVSGATNGFKDIVRTITLDNVNNKILVGGKFNIVNNQHIENFCRLNSDGSVDTAFHSQLGVGYGNIVNSITMDTANNRMLIGGDYNTFSGLSTLGICCYNPDGSKNLSFNDFAGFNNNIFMIAKQPDDKILIGGKFTKYSGYSSNAIIRLNSNGTVDTSFTSYIDYVGNEIWAISVQPDGKIVIGGYFTTYGGVQLLYDITRLNSNGTRDTGFAAGQTLPANYTTVVLKLQADGKILAGGNYNTGAIFRFLTTGAKDTTFTGTSFVGVPYSIDMQADGKAIIGGLGNGRHIVRANIDGSLDGTFNTGFTPSTSFNAQLYSVLVQPDGKIVAAGIFTAYSGVTANRIIRLNPDGSIDSSFNTGTGFNDGAYKLTYEPSGNTIVVSGQFTTYNGQPYNRILKLNLDGTVYSGFNNTNVLDDYAYGSVVQSNGNVITVGNFTRCNGFRQSKFSAVDYSGNITTDAISNSANTFNGMITTVSINSRQEIFVGGDFTKYNNFDVVRAYMLEKDLTQIRPIPTIAGFNLLVNFSMFQPDDKLLIGGKFSAFNNVTNGRISRLLTGVEKTFLINTIQDNNNNIILK